MNESKLMTNAAFIFPKSPEVKEELYEASYFPSLTLFIISSIYDNKIIYGY